jgi:hypothetical protein
MAKDFVLQLRYLGVFPQSGHREYRFHIENEGSEIRDVSLTIEDDLFRTNRLMFQEAPDLCYQKLLAQVRSENCEVPVLSRSAITAMDIQSYRENHPTAKLRRSHVRN